MGALKQDKIFDQKTIMIIDDDEGIRRSLESRLTVMGCKILTAVNGKHALQTILSRSDIDLILADLNMPGMNGLQLKAALKQSEANFSVPFIMLTAMKDGEMVKRAAMLGIKYYVVKPFKYEDLFKKMTNALCEAKA